MKFVDPLKSLFLGKESADSASAPPQAADDDSAKLAETQWTETQSTQAQSTEVPEAEAPLPTGTAAPANTRPTSARLANLPPDIRQPMRSIHDPPIRAESASALTAPTHVQGLQTAPVEAAPELSAKPLSTSATVATPLAETLSPTEATATETHSQESASGESVSGELPPVEALPVETVPPPVVDLPFSTTTAATTAHTAVRAAETALLSTDGLPGQTMAPPAKTETSPLVAAPTTPSPTGAKRPTVSTFSPDILRRSQPSPTEASHPPDGTNPAEKTELPLLKSETRRQQSPEADALRMGCGWSNRDTDRTWILVETTQGDSHPGSVHLGDLAKFVEKGVLAGGGSPAHYTCTDICDGIAQGTDGMDFSLPSREVITMAVEMHAEGGHFDGAVLLAGCDKSLPAHLIAACRLNLPTIVVPGGVMPAGPEGFTLEGIGAVHPQKERGEIDDATYRFLQQAACPSAGSCAFFGTAATMQLLAEVLGLALPATGLIPAHLNALKQAARVAGEHIITLVKKDIRPSHIVTQAALDNALMVHAATGGSTNALIHLAAIATELGLEFSLNRVNQINQQVPFILNLKPSGRFTSDKIWFAGGVPRIMKELQAYLNLDVLTVTGKSWKENLEQLELARHFEQMPRWLAGEGGKVEDIIRPVSQPLRPTGAVRILYGNLAPEGAVIKVSALSEGMQRFTGPARVFNSQQEALQVVRAGQIHPGEVLVIRYEGPGATGMPEMFYITEAIASNPLWATRVVLITDGRFSGATRGAAIGHVSPEAARGGPLAYVQDGDLIHYDVEAGTLNIVGVAGERLSPSSLATMLEVRAQRPLKVPRKYNRGLLGWYTRYARPVREGGGL
ncbi:MAG: dihydroxy-acid dehydratase [Candidatus Melainabacteria bacterium]|nr:dihydroxy-acid dehydratase [Candidatus Melainabacteria bacterium]